MVQKEATCSNKWQWSHLSEAAQTSGESFIILLRLTLGQGTQTRSMGVYLNSGSSACSHMEPRSNKEGRQLHSKTVLPAGVLIMALALAHTTAAWELLSFFFWVVLRICSKNQLHQEFIWTNNQEDTTTSRVCNFPSSGVNRKKVLDHKLTADQVNFVHTPGVWNNWDMSTVMETSP